MKCKYYYLSNESCVLLSTISNLELIENVRLIVWSLIVAFEDLTRDIKSALDVSDLTDAKKNDIMC